ncbi:hypothetical protein EGW08_012202, partial [Elysia chlorotica]
ARLVPWLHLFTPVPVKVRTSLFEDSCYFSDSSSDCSLVETSGCLGKPQGAQSSMILRPQDGHEVCLNTNSTKQIGSAYPRNNYSMNEKSETIQRTTNASSWHQQSRESTTHGHFFIENGSPSANRKEQYSTDLNDSAGEAFSWDNIVQKTKDMAGGVVQWQSDVGETNKIIDVSVGSSANNTTEESPMYGRTGDKLSLEANWIPESYFYFGNSENGNFQYMCQSQQSQAVDPSQNGASGNLTFMSRVEYVVEEPVDVCRQSLFSEGANCLVRSDNLSLTNDQQNQIVDILPIKPSADSFGPEHKLPCATSLLMGSRVDEQVINGLGYPVGQICIERTVNTSRLKTLAALGYESNPSGRDGNRKEMTSSCPLTPGGPTSRSLSRGHRVKGLGDDRRPSSPLVIMERRAAAEGQATMSGVGQCPYTGADIFGQSALYTPFSSYAGSLLDSTRRHPQSSSEHPSTRPLVWEYESLLYAQNNHRHVYRHRHGETRLSSVGQSDAHDGIAEEESGDSVFLPDQPEPGSAVVTSNASASVQSKTFSTRDSAPSNPTFRDYGFRSHRRECDSNAAARVFAPTDPFEDILDEEKYKASWSIDLLNLNPDLTPVQDPECVLSSLAHIFEEDQGSQKSCCPPTYVRSTEHRHGSSLNYEFNCHPDSHILPDASAIIISHPHGGRKLVSSGFFSRHFHVGGNLYDTPTCMGSCGAPVISLAADGAELHVTSLVHAGNVTVNGITTGMGVEFFPPVQLSDIRYTE